MNRTLRTVPVCHLSVTTTRKLHGGCPWVRDFKHLHRRSRVGGRNTPLTCTDAPRQRLRHGVARCVTRHRKPSPAARRAAARRAVILPPGARIPAEARPTSHSSHTTPGVSRAALRQCGGKGAERTRRVSLEVRRRFQAAPPRRSTRAVATRRGVQLSPVPRARLPAREGHEVCSVRALRAAPRGSRLATRWWSTPTARSTR